MKETSWSIELEKELIDDFQNLTTSTISVHIIGVVVFIFRIVDNLFFISRREYTWLCNAMSVQCWPSDDFVDIHFNLFANRNRFRVRNNHVFSVSNVQKTENINQSKRNEDLIENISVFMIWLNVRVLKHIIKKEKAYNGSVHTMAMTFLCMNI